MEQTNDLERIQWPCPNCNQDTSETKWICCCSQQCLKMWLDKTNVDKSEWPNNISSDCITPNFRKKF